MKVQTLRRSVIILAAVLIVLVGVALSLTGAPQKNEVPLSGWQTGENGCFYLVDGQRLYGWQQIQEAMHYFDSETGILASGWLTLHNEKYLLDDNGSPTIGLFPCPQGSYYFDADGKMVTGWVDFPEGKRYFTADGTMAVGFTDIDNNRYCFNQGGFMCTGWQDLQDAKYYFDEAGIMITTPGWLKTEKGTWYLKEDGQPYTGWMHTDSARYYFLEDGTMAVGYFHIDGVYRYFSSDGNYIPLINPWNKVPDDYELRLVKVEGLQVDSTCAEALTQMIKAARKAGLTCVLNSTYRDMATQTYLWNRRYNDYLSKGYSKEDAYRLSARRVAYPGTSEHHTGLAIDIKGTEELYQWFRDHAWEYGFHVRYRGDKEEFTGIKDEPWHLRYLGKEVAQALQESGMCYEEFLSQFTS